MRPDRVWFSGFSFLNWGIDFITFCLERGILTFKREARTLKLVKMVQKADFVPFFAALMPETCTTTKLEKDFWLNVFRRGLNNLDAVLNSQGRKIRDFCLKRNLG